MPLLHSCQIMSKKLYFKNFSEWFWLKIKKEHISQIINKANKGVSIIRKPRSCLPCFLLLTLYKSFVRPHLDYGDVMYDQSDNLLFIQKIKSIQYNTVLAITGLIRGSSREKLLRIKIKKLENAFLVDETFFYYTQLEIKNASCI